MLDNGETGNLTVTLMNQGPNNVNHVTLTIDIENPNVTFPNGNVADVPAAAEERQEHGLDPRGVNGAAGIEVDRLHDLDRRAGARAAGRFNVTATHRLNYDEVPRSSATESVEPRITAGRIAGDPVALPNITSWQRRALSPTQHVWWGPDNNGQTDGSRPTLPDQQILVSPAMRSAPAR